MKHALAGIVAAASISIAIAAQAPPAAIVATNNPEVDRHVAAAKAAAGSNWGGLYTAVCGDAVGFTQPAAPRGGGAGRGARGGGARRGGGGGAAPGGPPRESWHAEPVKVFDNLYYVGMTEYSAWAITTSDGIILLDAIYDYSVEDEVTGGLKTLGLDPRTIKYVIVSHGHLDHAGGAKYLQDTYGAKLIMSAADYDLLDQQNPSWKPKRDMVATDGMKLTLGDTTLTLYLTPGHTLGTISTIIPLRDGAARHTAAAWGGTRFNFGRNSEQLTMYAKSAERFRDIAAAAKADVLLSNHTEFDGSKTKLPAVMTRKPGAPHPYVVGTDGVRGYLTIANECGQAAVAAVSQPAQ
ncbi:MAG TPA: MBL fold metallo-hydrolase [Vicinamibacterales bacterium]|nr:MBL fold metallo-hydrolase [Vicinamibacterales bacterium]